jgi:hypothetical protein
VARFMLISKLIMTRHLLRAVLAIAISFVLLYYGIAWAVLRCSHDAKHAGHEVALQDLDATHQRFHHASVNAVDLDLECVGPDVHTETMAETSSSPQLDQLVPEVTRHMNAFLTLQSRLADAATGVGLRTVFERLRSLVFLIGLPSYLFLSILRI